MIAESIIIRTAYEAVEDVLRYDEEYFDLLEQSKFLTIEKDGEQFIVDFGFKNTIFRIRIDGLSGILHSFSIVEGST
jgi:hypothetical protein